MADVLQIRRDTLANWTSVNPVLAKGEFGYETDTEKLRIGDGVTAFLSLQQFNNGNSAVWGSLTGTLANQTDLQAILDGKEAADATILKDADIGVSVQPYEISTLFSSDIGVTLQAYDATILNDADIGLNVQAYDATILVDADIGVNIASFGHDHLGVYEASNANIQAHIADGSQHTDTIYDSTVVDAHIADGTLHFTQASISITESQISDFGTYLTSQITHADVLVDGDFATAGFMKTNGAGFYSIDSNSYSLDGHTHANMDFDAIIPNASSKINTPIHMPTIDDYIDHMWSPTIVDGAVITDNLNGTVDIAETELTIRGGDEHTQLYTARIAATAGVVLTDNALNVVYADWNAGSPVIAVTLDPTTVDIQTKIPMYVIVREGNSLIIVGSLEEGVDSNAKLRKRFFFTEQYKRVDGGSVVSETGTRNLGCTAGSYYFGLRKLDHDAIDTSVIDTFEYYSLINGSWVETNETQFDNLQYNNITVPGSESLSNLGNSKYAVHWVYVIPNDVATHFHVLYSQDQYGTLAEAQASGIPVQAPPSIAGLGQLLGRYIIRKSNAIGIMESVWTEVFAPAVATTHNGLADLQGGTTDQYYHFTSTEHTDVLAHIDVVTGNPHNVTAAEVGLGNVDNTSDVNKPVSTAQQTALDLKINTTEIGTSVQGYNATTTLDADVTYELLNANGDVGTLAGQLAIGNHTHTGIYEPADATILKDVDIGSTVAAEAHVHEGTEIDSTLVTDGYVLTADGAGNSVWEVAAGGVSDHGDLTGLADDDHTQYHNDARGDARYVELTGDIMTGQLSGITPTLDQHLTRKDYVDDNFINNSVFVTSPSEVADTTKFTKFARVTLSTRYQYSDSLLELLEAKSGSAVIQQHRLNIRVKQQAAFGSDPVVDVIFSSIEGTEGVNLPTISYVVVQNTPTTIVDFYIQLNLNYSAYWGTKITANSLDSFTEWLSNQPWVVAPGGTNITLDIMPNKTYVDTVSKQVAAPATATSTGTTGNIAFDASYFYVCTATNTWKRTAIATW